MKTIRINQGVYNITVGNREFYLEQECAIRPELRDRTWRLTEIVGPDLGYCNHFRTKKEAIAALKEIERQYPVVTKKKAGRYVVECGDYVYVVFRVDGVWFVERGLTRIYGEFKTKKEALAFIEQNASSVGEVKYILTAESIVVKCAGSVYEIRRDEKYDMWDMVMHFSDGTEETIDCAFNLSVMISALEFRLGIKPGLLPSLS